MIPITLIQCDFFLYYGSFTLYTKTIINYKRKGINENFLRALDGIALISLYNVYHNKYRMTSEQFGH